MESYCGSKHENISTNIIEFFTTILKFSSLKWKKKSSYLVSSQGLEKEFQQFARRGKTHNQLNSQPILIAKKPTPIITVFWHKPCTI